jgi:dTDP-4-dehydrorhamnose reductase
MKVLVIGAAGRLGRGLLKPLSQAGHEVYGADALSLPSDESITISALDVTDFAATQRLMAELRPDCVIHTAAWTDVDACAREPQKALVINGYGAQNVAVASAAVGAEMVYVSTNEVFDGRSAQAYNEYDITQPLNPYAYSKWVGERAVMSVQPRHYIARTAWLFAHGGKNFIQAILNAAKAGKPLRVVIDEVANPTYNDDLAEALTALISTGRYGIYHMVNEGAVSRYQFARYVLDCTGFADVAIQPISAREWTRPSQPPAYAALQNTCGALVGVRLRDWQSAVRVFLDKESLLISVTEDKA